MHIYLYTQLSNSVFIYASKWPCNYYHYVGDSGRLCVIHKKVDKHCAIHCDSLTLSKQAS